MKLSLVAILSMSVLYGNTMQIKSEEYKELKTTISEMQEQIDTVQQHDAKDNIKFTIDFRTEYNSINYDYNDYSYAGEDLSGTSAKNDSLLTSRLYLNMKSSPMDKLTFTGQIAAYSTWGGSHLSHDSTSKEWSTSSKASDTLFRVRQAYFVYSDTLSDDLPYAFSVGRRPSTDGFLANHREGDKAPGSPLAHITNMEVDAAMFQLDLSKYVLPGSYVKMVYGRAHTGGIETLYDNYGYAPYAQDESDADENVDFFLVLGSIYNNGQYNLMFEHASIFNTKGARADSPAGGENKSLDAGTAYLDALSFQMTGVGDMVNDFLDDTTLFASIARTQYNPDSGYQLLGSTENNTGYSWWAGFTIPDMITERGKLGFEYNHGSEYWTPMTWAEDSVIGSKVAVRGDAYEAYWNFNMFGLKNLTGQLRYTYLQHDYTPSVRCAGWVEPQKVDIEAQDIRAFIRYQY